MTPCATCGVPHGVSACTVIPACDAWNRTKNVMFFQSDTPKSDILNPPQIPNQGFNCRTNCHFVFLWTRRFISKCQVKNSRFIIFARLGVSQAKNSWCVQLLRDPWRCLHVLLFWPVIPVTGGETLICCQLDSTKSERFKNSSGLNTRGEEGPVFERSSGQTEPKMTLPCSVPLPPPSPGRPRPPAALPSSPLSVPTPAPYM